VISRSKPVIIAQSILTGLGIVFGATVLADIVDPRLPALGAVLVLAAKGGLDFYTNATTTPSAQVVATQAAPGEPVLAGPASPVTTGVELNQPKHASGGVVDAGHPYIIGEKGPEV
jgi:hypothetical protein